MVEWRTLDLADLPEWPRAVQIGLLVVMFLGCQAVGYQLYWTPLWSEWQLSRQQEQAVQAQLDLATHQVARLPQYQQQVQRLRQVIDTQWQAVSNEQNLASVLDTLNKVAAQYQVTFNRLDWGASQQEDERDSLPLQIEITGEYHAIGQFIAKMAALPRALSFESLQWQRVSQRSEQLRLSVRAVMYQYHSLPLSSDDERSVDSERSVNRELSTGGLSTGGQDAK